MAFNKRGEAVKSAVLTEMQVRTARGMYATARCSVRELARMFGISASAMGRVLRGESWAHLPLERRPTLAESQAVRARRCWEVRRTSQTSPPAMTRKRARCLTSAEVIEMRALYATGEWSVGMLTVRFGRCKSAIHSALHGESYAELPLGDVPTHEQQQVVRVRRWHAARQLAMR